MLFGEGNKSYCGSSDFFFWNAPKSDETTFQKVTPTQRPRNIGGSQVDFCAPNIPASRS